MCWACDNPDAPYEEYAELVRSTIDQYGWFIQSVYGERYHPPFSYTVGLTLHGLPELLLNGLSHHDATPLLNNLTHHVVHHGGRYTTGQTFTLVDGPAIEVVQINEPTAHLHTAVNLFGPIVAAQQLVYADDRGHWPWDVGFRGRQRVFGPRSPKAA